ncbi:hypothetical protein JCM10213_005174 [Rhodosporidiobolus nylandii]
MAPTPRKPSLAGKKRRASLPSSSAVASTSAATLDSPAPKGKKGAAKKGRKSLPARLQPEQEDEDEEQSQPKEDSRFAAFLAEAEDEPAVEEQDDEGEAEVNLDEDEELDAGEVDLDEDALPAGGDERFSAFPAEDEEVELTEKELLARTTLPAHLLPRSLAAKKAGKAAKTPGLVYLSRIPPGMGPGKVKHLLSAFGEVGRIYLARADKGKEISAAKKYKQKERHQSHNFKEGWVEYLDKRVARSVAEMLNAQTIGGKKSDRWHDDVWTMKYLPRFRWDQLSEQVALERATQTSLLRFHLTHSKAEQESYLSAVERARTNSKIEEKAASRGKAPKRKADSEAGADGEGAGGKRKREYRQREAVDVSKKLKRGGGGEKEQLESVLGRLF